MPARRQFVVGEKGSPFLPGELGWNRLLKSVPLLPLFRFRRCPWCWTRGVSIPPAHCRLLGTSKCCFHMTPRGHGCLFFFVLRGRQRPLESGEGRRLGGRSVVFPNRLPSVVVRTPPRVAPYMRRRCCCISFSLLLPSSSLSSFSSSLSIIFSSNLMKIVFFFF